MRDNSGSPGLRESIKNNIKIELSNSTIHLALILIFPLSSKTYRNSKFRKMFNTQTVWQL